MIDLEALLPTRRFFNTVMDDCHMVVRCQLAPLVRRLEGQLFTQVSVPFSRKDKTKKSEAMTSQQRQLIQWTHWMTAHRSRALFQRHQDRVFKI